MSQKQGNSKISQSFHMGKIKRKNSLTGTSGHKDFQLSEQQAELIQSKLPKIFRLIKVGNGDLQKIRQQLRLNSSKNIQQHQIKPQIFIEEKKMEKKSGGKIKRGPTLPSKKYQQEDFSQLNQPFVEKSQKNKKEPTHKKKASLKYNIEPQQEIVEPIQQNYELSQKELKKSKVLQPLKQKNSFIPQIPLQPNLLNTVLTVKEEQQIVNSYIPSLPNCQPRYVPLPPDFQYDGSLQVNTLRYMYGLGYKPPIEQMTKLNQKQKNFCIHLVQRLKAHKSSQPFRVAVDPVGQGVPDYYHVVYSPMDLQTIYRKIIKDKYKEISEFHLDVNTIILNSYKYNLRQTVYFQLTVEFEDYYQSLLRQAQKNPQDFSKQYIPKCIKKKPVDDQGELDFTEKTPIKEKKKINPIKGSFNPQKQRKQQRGGKTKSIFDDPNASAVISQLNNQQSLSEQNEQSDYKENPKQKIRERIKEKHVQRQRSNQVQVNYQRSRQKRSKQAILKKLNLHKTQSMPYDKQEIDIFSQSQFHNTQSNTSNLMYPNSYNSYNEPTKKRSRNNKNKRKVSPIKQKSKQKEIQRQRQKPIKKQKQMIPQNSISQVNQNQQSALKQSPILKQNQIISQPQLQQQQQFNTFQPQITSHYKNKQQIKQYPQQINQIQQRNSSKSKKINILNDDYNDDDQIQDHYYKQEYQKMQEQRSDLGLSVLDQKNIQNQNYNKKHQAQQLDYQIQDLVKSGIYQSYDNNNNSNNNNNRIERNRNNEQIQSQKIKNTYIQQTIIQQPQFYVPTKPKNRINSSINSTIQTKSRRNKNQQQKNINNTTNQSSINTNTNTNMNTTMNTNTNINNTSNLTNQFHTSNISTMQPQPKYNEITMYVNPKNTTNVNMIQQQNRTSLKYRANVNVNHQQKYITINNLNTHPIQYKDIKQNNNNNNSIHLNKQLLEQINNQLKIKQQLINQSVAGMQQKDSKALTQNIQQKTKIIVKAKKNKNKDKNVDDQYRCSSEDDQYVLNQHRYTKRTKNKTIKAKISAKQKQSKDSSDDGNPMKRKRGRQSKKIKQIPSSNQSQKNTINQQKKMQKLSESISIPIGLQNLLFVNAQQQNPQIPSISNSNNNSNNNNNQVNKMQSFGKIQQKSGFVSNIFMDQQNQSSSNSSKVDSNQELFDFS